MNGNLIKWAVGTLLPMVLMLGIWVGTIEARVQANFHKTLANEIKADKINEIDKKVTAILCKIDPEKCL